MANTTALQKPRKKPEPPCLALGLEDAAKSVGVGSVRTLSRWFDEGLPFVQPVPGGRRLIRVADLDAFLVSKQRVKGQELDQLVGETVSELGLQGGQR